MHFDHWNAVLTIQLKSCKNGGEMAQSPKMIKKTFFSSVKKFLSAKLFYGHVERVFDNTAKIFCLRLQKKSRCTETKKKQDFFQNNKYILPQIVPLDTKNSVFQTT